MSQQFWYLSHLQAKIRFDVNEVHMKCKTLVPQKNQEMSCIYIAEKLSAANFVNFRLSVFPV